MSTTNDQIENFRTPENGSGGPRSWRDRPVYVALLDAMRAGTTPDGEALTGLLAATRPNDEEAFVTAFATAAGEAVSMWEAGDQGAARELARERAAELDEKFETTDARRDAELAAKDSRKAAREASLDPHALASDVGGSPLGRGLR